jgi:enamine deaminase RidA (YjgF/YER057c/UK114 family)
MQTEIVMQTLLPEGWAAPVGYANGIKVANGGHTIYVAGQVGWNHEQVFANDDLVVQFEQALKNVLTVLAMGGGAPEHICRMTVYCCDKPGYLKARRQLGRIWRDLMGSHYPAMSMIFVSDLLDHPGKVELEATAVIPASQDQE